MTIEGITPDALWVFLYVLVGIAGIVVLADKVLDVFRKRKTRTEAEAEEPLLAIRNRLTEVEKKLDRVNEKLDNDNRRLNALEEEQKDIHKGFSVLATANLAMLEHVMHNGNTQQMEDAKEKLVEYLTR